MKKMMLSFTVCLLAVSAFLFAKEEISGTSKEIPVQLRALSGSWRLVGIADKTIDLTSYYKIVEADTFYSYRMDPVEGRRPTSYGRYEVGKDGGIIEHTLGDHRHAGRTFDAEIKYEVNDDAWLVLRYRLAGNKEWNSETYVRTSVENPKELYELTINDEKRKVDEIWVAYRKANEKGRKLVKHKKYGEAAAVLREALKEYEKQPVVLQANTDGVKEGFLYDIACCHSLQDKKAEAIEAFGQAVEAGYDNYYHVLEDKDLDNIRSKKEFKDLLEKVRSVGDFLCILKQGGAYEKETNHNLPRFVYANPQDGDLLRVRKYFNLDSIAGNGDEISRIKNLLAWVHNAVRHDGSSQSPSVGWNAIDLVNVCRVKDRGINCRMMATVLNECYLAMGFKSRFVTCLPKVMKSDCHVINVVYSETLGKWLWMDPTFNAYMSDDQGNLLGIAEVRERLRGDKPLVLNEDANWNNRSKQTKEEYLQYMSKNLYYMECHSVSAYEVERNEGYPNDRTVTLIPVGYVPDASNGMRTSDDKYFWQKPE